MKDINAIKENLYIGESIDEAMVTTNCRRGEYDGEEDYIDEDDGGENISYPTCGSVHSD